MKKVIFITIIVVMLFTALSICASAETVFETEKVIKAEDVYNAPLVQTTLDNSIGKYVFLSAGDVILDPVKITTPDLYFKFYAPKDGNYTLYLRGAFPNGGADSLFFKIDDDEWKDIHPQIKGETLYWLPVTINKYLTEGEHTFYLNHRETGTIFDCFSVIGSDGEFKIIVEGATLQSDVPPYVENGVSMIPFRALAEALGAEVSWDGENRSATLKTPLLSLTVVEDSKEAYFGKFPIKLDCPARIINGRFMVPVRFVASNLQHEIEWVAKTNHSFIVKK